MPKWSFQTYRVFWDVPRMVIATNEIGTYLFYSYFDDALDDYIDHYEVYELPPLSREDLRYSWEDLPKRSLRRLADIPVGALPLDRTRRKLLDFDPELLGTPS
jgi:hypothetical protein